MLSLSLTAKVLPRTLTLVVELGLARNVANGAAERPCAVQRALRAEQHLDALHVGHRQVHIQRNLADVGRDRVAARVAEELGGLERVQVEAAHDDVVGRAFALVDDVEPGHVAAELREVADLARFEQRVVERGDVERNVLDAELAARRGDDDRLELIGLSLRRRREAGSQRCGDCEGQRLRSE